MQEQQQYLNSNRAAKMQHLFSEICEKITIEMSVIKDVVIKNNCIKLVAKFKLIIARFGSKISTFTLKTKYCFQISQNCA